MNLVIGMSIHNAQQFNRRKTDKQWKQELAYYKKLNCIGCVLIHGFIFMCMLLSCFFVQRKINSLKNKSVAGNQNKLFKLENTSFALRIVTIVFSIISTLQLTLVVFFNTYICLPCDMTECFGTFKIKEPNLFDKVSIWLCRKIFGELNL